MIRYTLKHILKAAFVVVAFLVPMLLVPGLDETAAGLIEPLSAGLLQPPFEAMGAPGPSRVAYITIDDGPSRTITPRMLDILQAEGVPATFFVVPMGRNADNLFRRMIDEGHEVANHTFTHSNSTVYDSRNLDAFREEVLMAHNFVLDNYGYEMTSFRFPGGTGGRGERGVELRREILHELGYRDYDWHAYVGDASPGWESRSSATLANNVLNNTRDRENLIILMHDTGSKRATPGALERIIVGLREQGYIFDIMRNYDRNVQIMSERSP